MPDQAPPVTAPPAPRLAPPAGAKPAGGLPDCAPLGPVIDRELAACRRNGSSLVVLSIAVDGLEAVGRQHGEAIAHELLQAAWNRLRNHLRGSDLAVRVGASEFGAVLVNASWPAAAIVDARITAALSQPYGIGSREIAMTARTGAAIYPRAGTTGDTLLAAATQASTAKLRT